MLNYSGVILDSHLPPETESVSFPMETNVIYCDDNRLRLTSLPAGSVDLIYLDPPFFSNKHYEVIWGDEAEIRSFEDRWEGGIQVYINWMKDRVIELHRVLKPTGSLYLHCDWHAGHYLKVMLDEVVGAKQFRNDLIWHYSGWNKKLKNKFENRGDNILFYGKSGKQKFNGFTRPWKDEAEYVKVRKQKVRLDKDGRRYVLSDAGGGKRVPRYLDEAMKAGVYVDNVWDIDKLNNSSKELLGYPTQKPEVLLERIVKASSDPGDIVLDPFAGCGTTLVVAHRTARRWVGIDISPTAVNITKRRMERVGAKIKLVNMPTTESQLRTLKPFEFQNWVIQRFNGTYSPRDTGDMGIDGRSFFYHYPIQVKQSDSVGRNVVDNFETAIERDGHDAGYIVGFSFTKGAREECARAKAHRGQSIHLVTVEELLSKVPELAIAELGQLIDLPIPIARPVETLPSAEELVVSDLSA